MNIFKWLWNLITGHSTNTTTTQGGDTTTTTTQGNNPPDTTQTTTTDVVVDTSGNKPSFDPNHWPPNWSTKSERNYGGSLSKMGEFKGVVRCNTEDDAMGKRYFLRSHFEWDLKRQYGAKPGQVTIVIHQKDKRCIAWAVSTQDPQSLPLPK